jgi:short subunit dehydrogenase-like uncharacterized protein
MTSMSARDLDVVLFGATGFTGALTALHLAQHAEPRARIALAARSRAKLEEVRSGLGHAARDWELVEVDAADPVALRALAARARVIASAVGPYLRYGKEVARACAEEGTHYADLAGEVLFVRWSIDELADRARETGAKIVHACGFDSIPSDLGVLVTAERAAQDGEGTLGEATLFVKSLRGGISGGTIDTGRQQAIVARADPEARRTLNDPHGLSPRRSEEPSSARRPPTGMLGSLRRYIPIERDAETGRWAGPFLMASFNTRVVRLSNTLTGWSYGRDFRYREQTDFGSSPVSPLMAGTMAVGLGGTVAGLSFKPTRMLLDRLLPKPGQGPSEQRRSRGRFWFEIRTTTSTGAKYLTRVGADLDPGYEGAAVMLGQSALCLALDAAELPDRSGVLTPATAMGDVLVERLRVHGFTFEVSRVDGT